MLIDTADVFEVSEFIAILKTRFQMTAHAERYRAELDAASTVTGFENAR